MEKIQNAVVNVVLKTKSNRMNQIINFNSLMHSFISAHVGMNQVFELSIVNYSNSYETVS